MCTMGGTERTCAHGFPCGLDKSNLDVFPVCYHWSASLLIDWVIKGLTEEKDILYKRDNNNMLFCAKKINAVCHHALPQGGSCEDLWDPSDHCFICERRTTNNDKMNNSMWQFFSNSHFQQYFFNTLCAVLKWLSWDLHKESKKNITIISLIIRVNQMWKGWE